LSYSLPDYSLQQSIRCATTRDLAVRRLCPAGDGASYIVALADGTFCYWKYDTNVIQRLDVKNEQADKEPEADDDRPPLGTITAMLQGEPETAFLYLGNEDGDFYICQLVEHQKEQFIQVIKHLDHHDDYISGITVSRAKRPSFWVVAMAQSPSSTSKSRQRPK
jgi:hypothetical protein